MSELPKGWSKCQLGNLVEFKYGKALPAKTRTNTGFPVYGSGGTVGYHEEFLVEGPVIVIGRKGSYGSVYKIDSPSFPIDTTYYIDRLYDQPIEFWFRYLQYLPLDQMNRSSAIPGLNRQDAYNLIVSIPPLNEQIRIANKLDSILAKVDKAQARLDKIPAILKRFRQSVLAAATSGELTKEWRTLNVVPETELEQIESYWQNELLRQGRKYKPYRYPQGDIDKLGWLPSKLGAICDVHVGSTPKRTEKTYWGGDVKWVSSSEVAFCEIFDTKEKITTLGLDNSSTRLHPPGTVMLAMIGQGKTRGQPAILRAEACHNQNTAALRVPEPFLLSEYLYYFLWEKYEETRKIGGGNNQKALNKATVQSIDISLPSIREQRAIVKKVERLFKKANKVEKQYLEAKARLERLTQSILAKAFRGELVPQDPNDEPAEKLLERILAEKEQSEPKKTTRKRMTNAKTAEKE
ncbi:type I restriction endonuclease subunit S [Vibrio parahaemolyticus]|nr:type I restriction endonuclease subunit S [Vibrio parahaemolyticus]